MNHAIQNAIQQWAGRLALGVASLCLLAAAPAGAVTLELELTGRVGAGPLPQAPLVATNAAGETFSVTRLDLLLSGFALRRPDGQWQASTNAVAFLSLTEGRTRVRVADFPAGDYDALRFAVGVPPELNHADAAKFPAGHALNPNLNGLHWSWQGGYIFLALEGRWQTTNSAASGFSFHLANDWNLTTVTLPLRLSLVRDTRLTLNLDIHSVLNGIAFARDGASTHSRTNDPIANRLVKGLATAFREENSAPLPVAPVAQRPRSPQLPEHFTPYRFVVSRFFPVPELPADNPLTEERVALGRMLFHETKLSRDNSLSCASCHDAGAAFSDSRRVSLGVDGRAGTRQAMPLFNLAWKREFFWDGRAASLREQVLMPIQDHAEMHETLVRVVAKLARAEGLAAIDYPAQFAAAFGSREITPEKLALALENFLLTLTSHDSKFDRAQRGEPGAALSELEQRGFELFFTEYDPRRGQFGADCFHCHGGANFSNHGFANNGLDLAPADAGRWLATKRAADRGLFAVPSLRNVAVTAPYMHDGRFATLEEAVAHYVTGVKPSATLDPNLAKHPDGGVPLSADDQAALVAFLKTLTDPRYLPASSRASAANP